MSLPRRILPSTAALTAFEAAARLGSATLAAQELSLTQGAVSRQIKALEQQLGCDLMRRSGRSLELTAAGKTYAQDIAGILAQLGKATVALQANPDGGVLHLAILPAFGMHWLAPRLPDFGRSYPEVTLNLSTHLGPFDLASSPYDAAIHFGRKDWPNAHHMFLAEETVLPVCAPGYLKPSADINTHTLLHLETRPRGWARWLAAHDQAMPVNPGMQFDQFSTMAQAAVHGLGVALLPTFVAQPYLDNSSLVLASKDPLQSIGNYFLVWPDTLNEPKILTKFLTWMKKQSVS